MVPVHLPPSLVNAVDQILGILLIALATAIAAFSTLLAPSSLMSVL